MKNKPIIIVSGEPYSIFSEIFFKVFKSKYYKKIKRPIVLVCSKKLIEMQMKKMGYSFKIRQIRESEIKNIKLDNRKINLINVKFNFRKVFDKISSKSSNYIEQSFKIALKIMKNKNGVALINGPISKKYFLKGKYNGITEYLSHKTKTDGKEVMLIYNQKLSVSPITTHIPLKNVSKNIHTKSIVNKMKIINKFFKQKLKKTPRFAVTGLNPHCESNFNASEEDKIIIPAIKKAKNLNLKVSGPHAADTIFIKKNIKKFDVVIGMYHDQVLTPIKTLYDFDAINITLGLPFIRISPDHGPNSSMVGLNKSDPRSLKQALILLKKIHGT